MYINTHCNYSLPTLIKLDNENIGGHLTPLQRAVKKLTDSQLSLPHGMNKKVKEKNTKK